MLTVVTYFWIDPARRRSYRFTPEHVVTLKAMVDRHLHMPHRFVCVTTEELGVNTVETVALDARKVLVPGTCSPKLLSWSPQAAELLGDRLLVLDLDIVIVDDITPLVGEKLFTIAGFNHPFGEPDIIEWRLRAEDVVLFHNPNFSLERRRAYFQGSVQLLTAGSRPQVWNDLFQPGAMERVNRRFGGFEQAWLSETLSWDEAFWDDTDGVYGAGRLGDVGETVQTELPENARIVVFPGDREPSQPEVQAKHPWLQEHYRV